MTDTYRWNNTDCATESDVEQKVVYPLLSEASGLGWPQSCILTKKYFQEHSIGKRKNKHGHYPDYILRAHGLPTVLVETKSPGSNIEEALREAAEYALAINQSFANGNPLTRIIATDGLSICWRRWDSSTETTCHNIKDLVPGLKAFDDLQTFAHYENISSESADTRRKIFTASWRKPIRLAGTDAILNREEHHSMFASELSPLIARFLAKDSDRDSLDIILRGYVTSDDRTHYERELETLLKDNASNAIRPGTVTISSSTKHEGRTKQQLLGDRPHKRSVTLLIGGVGSGKSLFLDRFNAVHMSNSDNYVRMLIDFNDAPLDSSKYKEWFAKSAAAQSHAICRMLGEDTDSLDYFLKLFGRRVQLEKNKLQGGDFPGKLSDEEFGTHIRKRITEWSEDDEAIVESFFNHIQGERNLEVLLIVDNTDKHTSRDQIDAFQTTINFTSTHPCSCIIALRDETYDLHANHPPLDAISKPRIFRIQPPQLIDVVTRRLDMMIEYLEKNSPDKLHYTIPNGTVIEYPKKDIRTYIDKVRRDIFGTDRRIRTLVSAIAGRNIRKALEMFNAILVSPYLSQDTSGLVGQYSNTTIPERDIIRALSRGKYSYYSDDRGDAYIHNVFQVPETLASADNFLIPELLSILIRSRKRTGELEIEGYRLVSILLTEPELLGYSEDAVLWAINYCWKRGLILAEGEFHSGVQPESYIKISASGYYHLNFLCEREEYISNAAMDTWIRDHLTADRISQTLRATRPSERDSPQYRVKRYHIFADYLASESHIHKDASTCDESRLAGLHTVRKCIEQIDQHRSQAPLHSQR